MVVCSHCKHTNPDSATQCESCYTPLPTTTSCPICGAPVQTDASFCGQCGSNIGSKSTEVEVTSNPSAIPDIPPIPDLEPLSPLIAPEPIMAASSGSVIPATVVSVKEEEEEKATTIAPPIAVQPSPPLSPTPEPIVTPVPSAPVVSPVPVTPQFKTQLQIQNAQLLHIQTNRIIELSQNLAVIHIGKPNDQIPPDIDVAGFPNSEIVSRIHADIRVEGDAYFIEDVGSANGTYINHNPLPPGNRHRLRPGDRISLGKGDLVTFLFQLS